jgi:hypothetical protein
LFVVTFTAVVTWGQKYAHAHSVGFAVALIAVVGGYTVVALRFGLRANRDVRALHAELKEQQLTSVSVVPAWEYRSPWELLGFPLIHIRLSNAGEKRGPVKAWIAVGDYAIGLLFAFGGLVIAPVSFGGLAVGLMPWGGAAFGVWAMGGLAVGVWTFGGFAVGWQAFGGLAMAWNAAWGGVALAREFALGGSAVAAQANNPIAEHFIKSNVFFIKMEIMAHHIAWLNLLWLLPLIGWWRLVEHKQKLRRQTL